MAKEFLEFISQCSESFGHECWMKGEGPIGVPTQMNPSVTSGSSARIGLCS